MYNVWGMGQTLADVLKAQRAELGLSQAKLAERAGISAAYIAQMELGQINMPSPKIMEQLARVLHVSLDTLVRAAGYQVGVSEEPSPPPIETDEFTEALLRKHHGNRRAARREAMDILARLDTNDN
jgi:transcriptional regulator with XRE-family HTH domain